MDLNKTGLVKIMFDHFCSEGKVTAMQSTCDKTHLTFKEGAEFT